MGSQSSLGTTVVIVLSALLVGSYALGNSINRRRLRRQTVWLRDALRRRGGAPAFRALGAFGAAAATEFDSGNVRRVEVILQLVLRDVAPVWLWRRLQRMPDSLSFRLVLEHPPNVEGDRLDPIVAAARRAVRSLPTNWISTRDRVVVAAPDDRQLSEFRRLTNELEHLQPWVVSVRRIPPHLLVTIPTPGDAKSFERAIDALWNVAASFARASARAGGSHTQE